MPLTPQEQRELDELELRDLEARDKAATGSPTQSDTDRFLIQRAGAIAGGGTAVPAPPVTGGTIDLALEAGIPALGQALASPVTPVGMAAVGGGLSALGNLLAQARRMVMGDQEKFSPGQLAQATAVGSIPFGGPAKNAARLTSPALQIAKDLGKSAITQGAVGLGGEAIKTGIDEGRLPTAGEALVSASIPAALGTLGTGVSQIAERYAQRAARVAENAEVFGAANVKATPGMLLPEELAGTEQKIARGKPTGDVAEGVDTARQSMTDELVAAAPRPAEGAAIFADVEPLLGKVSTTKAELSKLDEAAQVARAKATEAFTALQAAKTEGGEKAAAEVRKTAEKAVDEAFDANLQSVLGNARDLAAARLAGGSLGVDPATARTLFVEHVAKPLQAAFEEKSAQMYSLVDANARTFDAAPILDKVESLTRAASGKLPAKLQSSVNDIRDMLQSAEDGGLNVSLQDLRNTRAELLKRVQMGQELGSYEEKMIKEVASEITQQIDKQAVTALGEEGGAALKAANKFYSETRSLFDNPGVDVLFSPMPADEYVRKVVTGMKSSGINSDEYVGLQKLADKIGEFDPALGKQVTAQMNDNLKQSLIFGAASLDPASGQMKVDGAELLKTLEPMSRVAGTIEALGFGTRDKIAELKRLFDKYPSVANDVTPQQWDQLLASPAFKDAKGAKELRPALEPYLAAASADQDLVRSAILKNAGQTARAQSAYDKALGTLDAVNGDVAAARQRYDQLLNDPVAIALDNPNLPSSGYNAFASAFFDPKANAITNAELGSIVQTMRAGPPKVRETLTRLQERYIADRIAKYQTTGKSSELLEAPDSAAIAQFFNPVNPGDASTELARARTLLDPGQLDRLEAFARAAKAVDRYERLGMEAPKTGSYNVPVVGQVRRTLDAAVDLYRAHQYEKIAEALADPREFARVQTQKGDLLDTLGTGLRQGGAQGAGRVVDEKLDRN